MTWQKYNSSWEPHLWRVLLWSSLASKPQIPILGLSRHTDAAGLWQAYVWDVSNCLMLPFHQLSTAKADTHIKKYWKEVWLVHQFGKFLFLQLSDYNTVEPWIAYYIKAYWSTAQEVIWLEYISRWKAGMMQKQPARKSLGCNQREGCWESHPGIL